jgi:hypothetical protein
MWTLFWDMYSGGHIKEKPYDKIYIEASQDEAEIIFYNKFGHNPHRVTCTCCGPDYSIDNSESLEEASAYHRNCRYDKKCNKYIEEGDPEREWAKYLTLSEYLKEKDILVIRENEINPSDRIGTLPRQGYVWVD